MFPLKVLSLERDLERVKITQWKTWNACPYATELCLFKTQKIHWLSVPLLHHRRLPWFSLEQAIGGYSAVQRPQSVAPAFKYNSVRTIQCLRERYNATNSTNDRVSSGRPWVTKSRQDMYICRQHMNNRFPEPRKQHDRQLAITRDKLVMTLYKVWSPATLDVVVRPENPSLQFDIVKSVLSGLSNVKSSVISSVGISSSHMKFDITFQPWWQNKHLENVSWEETHGVDQASWFGVESV